MVVSMSIWPNEKRTMVVSISAWQKQTGRSADMTKSVSIGVQSMSDEDPIDTPMQLMYGGI